MENGNKLGQNPASFMKLDAYSEISPVVTDTLAALRVVCAGGGG